MTGNRDGQVVTFYSYKGGTGRTMALANVAWILAANGKRVLVVDWDLESPGLYRFFNPFIDPGVLTSTRRRHRPDPRVRVGHDTRDRLGGRSWSATRACGVTRSRWTGHFPRRRNPRLPVGRAAEPDYAGTLAEFDWDNFYQHQDGGQFFDALREDMRRHYDYTLDRQPDRAQRCRRICTIHLPDILVDCFTFSEQGIDGAAQVAGPQTCAEQRPIRILPVPMRVDPAEKSKADAGRSWPMQRFDGLPLGMSRVRAASLLERRPGPVPGVLRLRGDARHLRRRARPRAVAC